MADIFNHFFDFLEFNESEKEQLIPEMKNAMRVFSLTEANLKYAIDEWIPKYFDVSLRGIRKMLNATIREFMVLARIGDYKAKGETVIYSNSTSYPPCVYANKLAAPEKVHVAYPSFVSMYVLEGIFGKRMEDMSDCLMLNAGCKHCNLNTNYANYALNGTIPVPTVDLHFGFLCNESAKTLELIKGLKHEGWPGVLVSIPHDKELGCAEVEYEDRIDYLAKAFEDAEKRVASFTGIEISRENLSEAESRYFEYLTKLEKINLLTVNSEVQPLAANDLVLLSILLEFSFDTGYGGVLDAMDTVIEELEERIRDKRGILPAGAPKLGCYQYPVAQPWISKEFERNGVGIAVIRLYPPASMFMERSESDPYRTAAVHCLMRPNTVNKKDESNIYINIMKNYNVDAMLCGFFAIDRWVGAMDKISMNEIEEETGIPHYYVDGNMWNSDSCRYEDKSLLIKNISNSIKIANF